MSKTLTDPFPVKLDVETAKMVEVLKRRSKLNRSEVLRRAVRYAAPKFLSGEVQLVDSSPALKSAS